MKREWSDLMRENVCKNRFIDNFHRKVTPNNEKVTAINQNNDNVCPHDNEKSVTRNYKHDGSPTAWKTPTIIRVFITNWARRWRHSIPLCAVRRINYFKKVWKVFEWFRKLKPGNLLILKPKKKIPIFVEMLVFLERGQWQTLFSFTWQLRKF